MGGVKKPFKGARDMYYNNRSTAPASAAPKDTRLRAGVPRYRMRNPYNSPTLQSDMPAHRYPIVTGKLPKYNSLKDLKPVGFGKRRRGRRGVRRYRFGNGGNPSLSSSMGYEFCSGGGGVLGANSTGLFPSPCMGAAMMGSGPAAAFGKRRRRRTTRRRM
jgi:hypothetical protein